MNDFLRPCNCVRPDEEDCEKCMEEAAPEKTPDPCCCKEKEKQAVPIARDLMPTLGKTETSQRPGRTGVPPV
ncbi:MAG: hypothetical protein WCQ16_12020 [Verrucomicrobiae bacterium]